MRIVTEVLLSIAKVLAYIEDIWTPPNITNSYLYSKIYSNGGNKETEKWRGFTC